MRHFALLCLLVAVTASPAFAGNDTESVITSVRGITQSSAQIVGEAATTHPSSIPFIAKQLVTTFRSLDETAKIHFRAQGDECGLAAAGSISRDCEKLARRYLLDRLSDEELKLHLEIQANTARIVELACLSE